MTAKCVGSFIVALAMLAPSVVTARQVPTQGLPNNLTITVTSTADQPAQLKFADSRQTFESQSQNVRVTRQEDRVQVTMTGGTFTWVSTGAPTYKDSYQTLELAFDWNGNMIAFRIE